jgi:hypothetical protein
MDGNSVLKEKIHQDRVTKRSHIPSSSYPPSELTTIFVSTRSPHVRSPVAKYVLCI